MSTISASSRPGPAPRIDWAAVRRDREATGASFGKLGEKYGVSRARVAKLAKDGGWRNGPSIDVPATVDVAATGGFRRGIKPPADVFDAPAPVREIPAGRQPPLDTLLMISSDPEVKVEIRVKAAAAAARYCHEPIAPVGKKQGREERAASATGKFAGRRAVPPGLKVISGGKG